MVIQLVVVPSSSRRADERVRFKTKPVPELRTGDESNQNSPLNKAKSSVAGNVIEFTFLLES